MQIILKKKDMFELWYTCDNIKKPSFRIYHIQTGMYCTVHFKSYLYVYTSRLQKFFLSLNESFTPMCLIIKYWAQVNGLLGTCQLNTYSLMLLILFFLQQPPRYIPSVQYLQKKMHAETIVDNWNVNFFDKINLMRQHTSKSLGILALMGEFFAFYATFNFRDFVVCPYLGKLILKSDFSNIGTLSDNFEKYKQNVNFFREPPLRHNTPMVVQDTFQLNNNLTSSLTLEIIDEFQAYCQFAFEAYKDGRKNNYKYFLRTILVGIPLHLRRFKFKIFTVKLKVYQNFECDVQSWRVIVKENLFTILKHICKISLFDVGETRTDSQVETVWLGIVHHRIWERDINTTYPADFLVKERNVTNAIRWDESRSTHFSFNLKIWYIDGTKFVHFVITHLNGSRHDYLKFGNFVQEEIFKWLFICTGPRSSEGFLSVLARALR
ncbi:terminal uridylyltransferase Tailor-like [Colias croceus]|uniref:terminal uridylyltransferase Tailor-like n=1 Tax=Colias crocea TaxID=72248 RepID=UPI001E27F23A|nr:terminal uridylyltransferase Tailor-like [Colias croceus]